jgi:transcriptional regulator with XRE-family HTH domain
VEATELYIERARRRKSQQDVATAIGVNRSRFRLIESGERSPALEELDALAQVYGLPFNAICKLAREAREARQAAEQPAPQEAWA